MPDLTSVRRAPIGGVSVSGSMSEQDQEFWINFRRALLSMVDAIERRQGIPSVIEQHERRQAAKKY
jgi:hypothetical protein